MHVIYAYLQNQFKQAGNGCIQLILIHIVIFALLFLFNTACYISGYEPQIGWLYRQLTLPSLYHLLLDRPWTIITYTFVHKGFIDLFWDIFILYMFGQKIRAISRSKHVLRLYVLGQIIGGVAFLILYQYSPSFKGIATELSGPSSSIYAVMVAVSVLMPTLRLYCFFFSLPLRYVTIGLIIVALTHLATQSAGYYLAQLSGALSGYIYARLCKNDLDINPSFFNTQTMRRTKMSITITKK